MAQAEIFQKYFADLVRSIQDPASLACELYSERIITESVRDAASTTLVRYQRALNLMSAVETKVKGEPHAFDVFLSVLRKETSDLHRRMRDEYGKNHRRVGSRGTRLWHSLVPLTQPLVSQARPNQPQRGSLSVSRTGY